MTEEDRDGIVLGLEARFIRHLDSTMGSVRFPAGHKGGSGFMFRKAYPSEYIKLMKEFYGI